jgi:predicted dehydrogenase
MEKSRRDFLKGSALATAASYNRILGANDRPRVGVIGTGGRGTYLIGEIKKAADVDIPAVCDIYDARRDKAAKLAGGDPKKYADYRQVLGHNDIDAVIIATPDHWHAPIAIDACKAGKDLYVEKPMVHNPKDGLAVVKAVRDHKRIFQHGTNSRHQKQIIDAKEQYVETGIMGTVGMARTWYTSNGGYDERPLPPDLKSGNKPEGLDWERWLGAAPKIPWNADVYFSWYRMQDYGGGQVMGIGIHVVDMARFVLKLGKPQVATAGGGTYFFKDGRDTPDTVALVIEFPNVTVTFMAESLDCPGVRISAGVELRGTGGKLSAEKYVVENALEYTPNKKYSKAPPAKIDGTIPNAEPHLKNWLDCIRTRQKAVANEEEGYYSTMACFMGNYAYRTHSRVVWDEKWTLPA